MRRSIILGIGVVLWTRLLGYVSKCRKLHPKSPGVFFLNHARSEFGNQHQSPILTPNQGKEDSASAPNEPVLVVGRGTHFEIVRCLCFHTLTLSCARRPGPLSCTLSLRNATVVHHIPQVDYFRKSGIPKLCCGVSEKPQGHELLLASQIC
jgi:hypothetical protein